MKSITLLILTLLISLQLFSQELKFNASDEIPHTGNGQIKSSPGIVGDNYYVWYNDYGSRFDFKNNIESYLKIYSIKKGTLIKNILLNPMVSEKEKKVLFNDIILWQGHIVGFYTLKNAMAGEFPIYAQLFDLKGGKIGKSVLLGSFPHHFTTVAQGPNQSGMTLINGKNSLTPADELMYAFNSDSTQITLYTASSPKRIGFTTINPDLTIQHKVEDLDLPMDNGAFEIIQFMRESNNMLYILVNELHGLLKYESSYVVYEVNTDTHKINKIPIELPEKVILNAKFLFNSAGDMTLTGTYRNTKGFLGKTNSTNGAFAIKIPANLHKATDLNIYEFPDEMVKTLRSKSAASKGKGLDEIIKIDHLIPLADHSILVEGQGEDSYVDQHGRTGAMNVLMFLHGDVIFYKITPDNKIAWSNYVTRIERNSDMLTSTGPIYASSYGDSIIVVHDVKRKENKMLPGIYFTDYQSTGTASQRYTPLPKKYNFDMDILWQTTQKINNNQLMVTYLRNMRNQTGTVVIPIP